MDYLSFRYRKKMLIESFMDKSRLEPIQDWPISKPYIFRADCKDGCDWLPA